MRITLIQDESLLAEAYHWQDTMPQWFRDSQNAWKETEEEYLEASKSELNYGVFLEDILVAVIRLIEVYPSVFNAHLMVKRGTSLETLIEAAKCLKDYLFHNGVYSLYGYIWNKNRGVCKLYEAIGFHDSGVRCYKGKIKGRLAQWKQYLCVVPQGNMT